MTQIEFENYLVEKLQEIKKVYAEYCPEQLYLSMYLSEDGSQIRANNSYWEDWCEHKVMLVHFTEEEEK